ncbi:MAG: transposase [Flavobacteriales bacterium]|nr:transposase [Flavobacteriales bacterium]
MDTLEFVRLYRLTNEFNSLVFQRSFVEKTVKLKDKILLRKRSVIETVNDELTNRCQIEHSRHRSFSGFLANTIAALIAYYFFTKKPAIKYQTLHSTQLTVF